MVLREGVFIVDYVATLPGCAAGRRVPHPAALTVMELARAASSTRNYGTDVARLALSTSTRPAASTAWTTRTPSRHTWRCCTTSARTAAPASSAQRAPDPATR